MRPDEEFDRDQLNSRDLKSDIKFVVFVLPYAADEELLNLTVNFTFH